MATMFDLYPLDQSLQQSIELARQAELPDTYEQLVKIRQLIVSEFKAVRALKSVGASYPAP
jgi:hypothetical protein